MNSLPALKTYLSNSFDALLSIKSSPNSITKALKELEDLITKLALQDFNSSFDLLNALLVLQDGFEFNVTARLLEFLGRYSIELQRLGKKENEGLEVILKYFESCFEIIQGLLLLHRGSQRLFARRATVEYLVFILDSLRGRSSALPPATSTSDSSPRSAIDLKASVSLGILNTLLCALVDRPRNIRTFELVGGLKSVVKVLKDKSVARVVRIKAIEILYYYLLPETTSTETINSNPQQKLSNDFLETLEKDFIPQTPTSNRSFTHNHSRTGSYDSLISSSDGREGGSRRGSSISSFESIQEERVVSNEVGKECGKDDTPKAIRIHPPISRSKSTSSHSINQFSIPPSSSLSTHSTFSNGLRRDASDSGGGTIRKTELEKKEMLRKVMGNVDALETRFKEMRLSGFGV